MIRTCSSSHRKIHRLDTFRPNSSLANYPQSNRTYRQLSRRQPHSTTLLPRFFRIRRVPRIPLVKLRRRAERKFLVPNSSLSLSSKWVSTWGFRCLETLLPVRLQGAASHRYVPTLPSTHCFTSWLCVQSRVSLYNPFASPMLTTLKTVGKWNGTTRGYNELKRFVEYFANESLLFLLFFFFLKIKQRSIYQLTCECYRKRLRTKINKKLAFVNERNNLG